MMVTKRNMELKTYTVDAEFNQFSDLLAYQLSSHRGWTHPHYRRNAY
jgi:hypothetical protein